MQSTSTTRSLPVILGCLLAPLAATAQPSGAPTSEGGTSFSAQLESAYTSSGRAEFGGLKPAKSDAFTMDLGARGRTGLSDDWFIPFGLESQNSWLDTIAGLPIPDRVHTLRLSGGLGWKFSEDWTLTATLSPSLYKFEDIGGNDIGLAGGVTALWRYNPSLTFFFGLFVSPDSDVPVLPAVGLDWRINEEWELKLTYPKPRLVYRPDERVSYYVGADIRTDTFRTSDTLGTALGMTQYNDALATYRDIRVGLGAGFRLAENVGLEVEAGCSAHRQIDYTRIEEEVTFNPAPYVRLGLNARF